MAHKTDFTPGQFSIDEFFAWIAVYSDLGPGTVNIPNAISVINPDGTVVGSGGGGSVNANLHDGLGNAITSAVAGAKRPIDVVLIDSVGAIVDAAKDATLVTLSAKLPATLGQKTKATALGVTLASDEDNLGVALHDGSGVAVTSAAAGATRPLDVGVRDASGGLIDTFGGYPDVTEVADADDHTDWTLAGNGANKADSTTHIRGTGSVSFDKAAGGTAVSIRQTLGAAVDLRSAGGHPVLGFAFYLSSMIDVSLIRVKVGTSAVHYNIYEVLDDVVQNAGAIYQPYFAKLWERPTTTGGNGADLSQVSWVEFEVIFDNAADTLAGILFDGFFAFQESRIVLGNPGQQKRHESQSVTMSNEDQVILDAIQTGTDKIPALGQSNKAGSTPVTLASDEDNLGVDLHAGDGTALTSATRGAEEALSVQVVDVAGAQITSFGTDPVGLKNVAAATINPATEDGNLATIDADTGNIVTSTANIDGKLPATIGQKAKAAALAVTLASDEDNLGIDLHDGAGVSVTVGQKTKAGALPVTLASDEDDINVNLQDGGGTDITSTARGATQPLDVQVRDAAGNQITTFGSTNTEGTPDAAAPAKGNMVGGKFETVRTIVETGDYAALTATEDGRVVTNPYDDSTAWTYTSAVLAAAQANVVVKAAPGAGLAIRVLGYAFSCDAAQNFRLEDEDDTIVVAKKYATAKQHPTNPPGFFKKLAANKALELDTDNAVNHTVEVFGDVVPA